VIEDNVAYAGFRDFMDEQDRAEHDPGPPDDEPAPDDERAQSRRIVLTPASKIKLRKVEWLWDTTPEGEFPTSHGRIPANTLALGSGGAGIGKSQFCAWFAARITRGTLPGALFGRPRSVIYAATEDDWERTIAPRLVAAGADLDRIYRIDVRDDEDLHARLTLPSDISLLGKASEQYNVALVIADPLLSLIDDKINDYRQKEVRNALEPLAACAGRHGFTVLGLVHFTKSGAADPLNRVSGSGAFGQVVRSVVAFVRNESEDGGPKFVMSQVKNNLGRLDLPSFSYSIEPVTVATEEGDAYLSKFVLGEETTTSVTQVMRAELQGSEDNGATGEAMEWLRGILADNGGSEKLSEIKKLAKKEGIAEATLYRASKKLGVRSKVVGFGKERTSTWYLREAWPTEEEA
jgi:hypothetical protein